jgi:hypothetical protein
MDLVEAKSPHCECPTISSPLPDTEQAEEALRPVLSDILLEDRFRDQETATDKAVEVHRRSELNVHERAHVSRNCLKFCDEWSLKRRVGDFDYRPRR